MRSKPSTQNYLARKALRPLGLGASYWEWMKTWTAPVVARPQIVLLVARFQGEVAAFHLAFAWLVDQGWPLAELVIASNLLALHLLPMLLHPGCPKLQDQMLASAFHCLHPVGCSMRRLPASLHPASRHWKRLA